MRFIYLPIEICGDSDDIYQWDVDKHQSPDNSFTIPARTFQGKGLLCLVEK